MAELYVQVLKGLRMVHTSEEPVAYSTTKNVHQGEVCVCVYDPFFNIYIHGFVQILRFGQTMKGTILLYIQMITRCYHQSRQKVHLKTKRTRISCTKGALNAVVRETKF